MYAAVIIVLFVIGMVIIVGMWWRNRALAKSAEAAQRVDRFSGEREMEELGMLGRERQIAKAD